MPLRRSVGTATACCRRSRMMRRPALSRRSDPRLLGLTRLLLDQSYNQVPANPVQPKRRGDAPVRAAGMWSTAATLRRGLFFTEGWISQDRKSTRLNSSHSSISYAVFCLKKKKKKKTHTSRSVLDFAFSPCPTVGHLSLCLW